MSIFKEHNIGAGRKVLRELTRVKRDFVGYFDWIKLRRVQRRYDDSWPSQTQVMEGAVNVTKKVAIIVLFQPDTLRKSTIETCNHLTANGYAVLAMSNAELTEESRTLLAPHVYQICERPNYGYDAGAYRDGVWLLRKFNLKPERLVLINDSIWFPLNAQNDTVERLEQQNGFFGGLVRKTNNKVDVKSLQEPDGFIEAYFYQVNLGAKARTEVWGQFWDQLKLTIGREYLKEDRASRYISGAGFALTALASRRSFLAGIEKMPTGELVKVLQYAAYSNPALAKNGAVLCAEPDKKTWREDALQHIRETVAMYPFYGSFVYGSEKLFGLGFLKKTNTPLFRKTRKAYLNAVKSGDLPAPSDVVLDELEAACQDDILATH